MDEFRYLYGDLAGLVIRYRLAFVAVWNVVASAWLAYYFDFISFIQLAALVLLLNLPFLLYMRILVLEMEDRGGFVVLPRAKVFAYAALLGLLYFFEAFGLKKLLSAYRGEDLATVMWWIGWVTFYGEAIAFLNLQMFFVVDIRMERKNKAKS